MPISLYAYAELGGHVLDVTGKRFASASHSVFNETSCSVTAAWTRCVNSAG